MRTDGLSVAGVSLLAVFAFVSVAAAMEPNGPVDSPAGALPAPAVTASRTGFPAFVAADVAPLLHDAWQTHASAAEDAAQAPALMRGDAMSAARAAMERIGAATRKAPAVRQAAEELSLRFSGLGGPSGTDEAADNVVVPTAIDANAEDAHASRQDEAEAAAVAASDAGATGHGAPVMATSAIPESEMRPQSAQLDELPPSLHTQTARSVTAPPPLPLRAPGAIARKAPAKPAPSRMVTVERPRIARESIDRGEVFPHYMRAFGWDDQP